MLDLNELDGWKSDATAQGHVQNAVRNKTKISNILTSAYTNIRNIYLSDRQPEPTN